MMLELVKGRPESTKGRLEKEIRTYDLLEQLGIEYEKESNSDYRMYYSDDIGHICWK